ncbi:hypothetical protein PRNP1_010350 [Phytophthora ramorum]
MKDDDLLNAVFRFKYKSPSDRQDAATCAALSKWFAAFAAKLEAVEGAEHKCGRLEPLADDRVVPASVFSAHEVESLRQVARRLTASGGRHQRGDVWYDPWLPMYGCALQRTMLNATTVKLDVVFVDGWERTLHFLPTGGCVHSAVPKTHHILHCADLDTELEMKFGTAFASELHKAQSCKGSERSAAKNELGHQKTPQFIAAVVRRAVASVMQGTSSVSSVNVAARGVHEGESIFCLDSMNLRNGCSSVDDMFYMLQAIVLHIVDLLECGYDVSAFQKQCTELRSRIGDFVDILNCQGAKRYTFPEADILRELHQLECGVKITSPKCIKDPDDHEGNTASHDRAWANLEGCCFLDGSSCSLSELLGWMKSNAAPAAYKGILILRTVEAFMYAASRQFNEEVCNQEPLGLERMQTLVTEYQAIARQWHQHRQMTSVLNVEQRSREMLVAWIAFCLVHQKCVVEVPLCAQYNIALDWTDLKVAVLSDRTAISALESVTRYIRGWNVATRGPPLFHLTNQDPTFQFGQAFGLSSTSMVDIYNREVDIWEAHVRAKWGVIEKKKREAAELRAETARLNENLWTNQRALANEEERLRLAYPGRHLQCYRRSSVRTQLKETIDRISWTIRQNEETLRRTLATPPYLVRPLPPAQGHALQVIFMLTLPRTLEILGSLCLTAQRALAPAGVTSEMMNLPMLSPTTWQLFYYQYAPSRALSATAKIFTARPAPFSLPSSWGPKTVDELYYLSQYKSQCVWDPSLHGTALTWMDASGANVNPFNATESSVIDSFIEQLPQSYRQLQWMNSWPGIGDIRGNLVYAKLHQQPEEFEKAAFIALGSLRAFANQQYRKLQWALREDIFPWGHPSVKTIVRQALYQVGALTNDVTPKLLWKTDMLQNERGLEVFCSTLEIIAGKLDQTPRNFENVPLLSELAGFALQFTQEAKQIVKLFAGMARRWAKNASSEYEEESSPRRIAVIRQKESVLYGYALLAYTLGSWDDEIGQEVCELLVLFRKSFLCASVTLRCTEIMIGVESRIQEMMARRTPDLIEYVNTCGANTVLTGLVRLVSTTSPNRLIWKQFKELSLNNGQLGSCFEAFDNPSNTHYSMNLFTGVVLTNGYAPGGLPADIREHERFQTLFGRSNFEVFSTNGVLRTERTFCGRLYDFALLADGGLFVQELIADTSGAVTRTLQLCSAGWANTLAELLPARLRELYSHWYWVEQNCILFRPTEAKCREIFFAATLNNGNIMQCYKIPLSDTSYPYQDIISRLDGYDRFVQKDVSLLEVFNVLAKFEEEKFLHPLKSPLEVLKIELPRFKVSFYLSNEMQFESVEHKGYILATNQQFEDFLPRFRRYLTLELKDRSDTSRPELRMLLPVGSVGDSSEDIVDISLPSEADCTIGVACYDLHRRLKTFETETICARLQLAAVCTRAGTNVPSKRLQMTGAEAALRILRACRSSRPFSDLERGALLTVYKLSYREPAVKILALALLTDSNRLAFLFGGTQPINTVTGSADEKAEYADLIAERVQRNPLRSQFRSSEEKLILGHMQHAAISGSPIEVVSCKSPPGANDYVTSTEKELSLFVRVDVTPKRTAPPLPLTSSTANAMSESMLNELNVSWKSYHSQAQPMLRAPPDVLLGAFTTILSDVASRRLETETYLWDAFARATNSIRDCLLGLANYLPLLTMSDIVQCAFDDETLHTLAPKLSEKARESFKKGVLQYMELCVLEDKVERLIWKAKRSGELSDAQLVDELVNERRWLSSTYPYWLAFEVEGRLQIRHEQFVIAQHLINGPGTVCQLNMGCGKTRVILPMLFLYFTQSRCPRVVRAHFLSPLLSEARQFMHRYLSASSARLGIFEQPFHRQIDLDTRRLEFMRDTIHDLKMCGGIQMVAPEHRMSLELKRLELGNDNPAAEMLDELLESDQFVDVLDECDALLHHKYHLVYAVGTPIPLCNGIERWQAAEALLRVIADTSSSSRVASVLLAPHVACFSPDYATRLGAYIGTRLNTVVERTKALREQLKKALVLDLIGNAPFELMWLNAFGSGDASESLVTAITDPDVSLQEALGDYMQKVTPYTCQLLALRGLVAFGVLEHCMEKRYRVNFGLPAPGTRPKKIAIPFRAADVPSDRSEFSHPDVCIVLTLLGYYHSGLTNVEVRNVFRMLLRLDISEQHQQYDRWYSSVELGLNEEDRKALCDVRHISLADAQQFKTLCRVYEFCVEAINFYLNTCVFPKDTQQYPQRLSRTAWNLAAGDNNIGFSGTNDNHRLLPLSVTQQEPNEPSLLGTNGKMIDKILQVAQSYEAIRPGPQTSPIPWQSVLLFAVDKRAQALIDTGALLAGVTNHDAADFLLGLPGFDFAGVTYYDGRQEHNCWMIAEKARQVKVPLKNASMLEKETFVIFDEARSRGSDMKLLPDAAAVLTLGPKLTKDKLMQGAGRMRQLGCDQTLWIASFDEVAQSILQASGTCDAADLAAIDVLNWVMANTKEEAVRGLLEWAGNGIHFRKTQLDQKAELVDDNWALEALYQEKLRIDKVAQVIQSKAQMDFKEATDALVSKICHRGLVYGLDEEVYVASHTDECERELQVEEEVQQMQEVEAMVCSPTREKSWKYSDILRAQSVESLDGVVQVIDMTKFIRQWVSPKELAGLSWTKAHIFGTENFFATILARTGLDRMNDFLRVVDVILVFTKGQVLLVSECEADHILELLWATNGRSPPCHFCFVNLAFACESIDRVGARPNFQDAYLSVGPRLDGALPMLSTIACHLYNGETMVAKHQRAAVEFPLRELLRPLVQREVTLSNFVKSRGSSHKWTRSFLHELCCRMDLDDCK